MAFVSIPTLVVSCRDILSSDFSKVTSGNDSGGHIRI
jgi:hypothetical protein